MESSDIDSTPPKCFYGRRPPSYWCYKLGASFFPENSNLLVRRSGHDSHYLKAFLSNECSNDPPGNSFAQLVSLVFKRALFPQGLLPLRKLVDGFGATPLIAAMPRELLWFDRDNDASGNPIRSDVREAAKQKWPQLRDLARRRLANRELEIQELFENVVAKVSGYLNEIHAPQQDPSGLLVLSFKQQLHSLARHLERFRASGTAKDMEPLVNRAERASSEDAERRIFLEEIVRSLSKTNRAALRLRGAGYNWHEIAVMFKTNASTLRNNFWREIRSLHGKLTGASSEQIADIEKERGTFS